MFFEEFPPVVGSRPAREPWFHQLADQSTVDDSTVVKRWLGTGDADRVLMIPRQRRPDPGS